MEQIVLTQFAISTLTQLADILFTKKYFSHIDKAEMYVQKIVEHVYNIDNYRTIHQCKNDKYGQYYIRYKPTRSTTQYYITYDIVDGIYYVQDIFTDKSSEYARYIRGIK